MSRVTPNEHAEIRNEVMREVRDALDRATDFEGFRDALEESDPMLPGLTVSEIAAMSADEILENKAAVDAVMARGSSGPAATDSPAPSPTRTGQQLHSEGAPGPAPLSWESLRSMSIEEYNARRAEVDAFVARNGGQAA